jgi:hypothetical protein
MLFPALDKSPQHARIIGRLVIGYNELEMTFAHCAALAIGLQYEVLNAIHQVRSESARINIADALSGNAFVKIGFGDEYAQTLGGMRHCLKIRNQYAHGQYQKIKGRLRFTTNDEETFSNDAKPFKWKTTNLPLLREQAELFEWTRRMLIWLELTLLNHRQLRKFQAPRPKARKSSLPKLYIDPSPSRIRRTVSSVRRRQ